MFQVIFHITKKEKDAAIAVLSDKKAQLEGLMKSDGNLITMQECELDTLKDANEALHNSLLAIQSQSSLQESVGEKQGGSESVSESGIVSRSAFLEAAIILIDYSYKLLL